MIVNIIMVSCTLGESLICGDSAFGFQSFMKVNSHAPLIFIRILDGGKNVLMASWTLGESI